MLNNPEKNHLSAADLAPKADAAAPVTGLPLFFSKPAIVETSRHANAGILTRQPLNFALPTNSIPVNATEFIEAAKYYPIAFTAADPVMPLVITGLEAHNYFVNDAGNWLEHTYIPAYVRKYPFVFLETPESDQMTLCIDESAPQFTMNAPEAGVLRLFDNGTPTEFTNNVLKFCSAYQEEYRLTRRFCQMLKELGLLVPNRSDVELPNDRKISLGGFQLIDRERFMQLPDERVLALHKQGWLPFIHYTFMSASNWRRLLDLAADQGDRGNAGIDPDTERSFAEYLVAGE